MPSSVLPGPVESITQGPSSNTLTFVYDIVPSAPLPAFDISRSVRSVFLRDKFNKRWSRFMAKTRLAFFVAYNVALVFNLIIFGSKNEAIHWGTIVTTGVAFYSVATQMALMRVDVIKLLLTTYEFWFVTVVNFITTVLLNMYVRGVRAVALWGWWFGCQSVVMADAHIASQRDFLIGTVGAIVLTTLLIISVLLSTLKGTHNTSLLQVNGLTLKATDVILNGLSTQLVIQIRNVYRRRAAIKEHGRNSSVVQCITYRCPVRLRPRRQPNLPSSSSSATRKKQEGAPRLTASFIASAKRVQMECRPVRLKSLLVSSLSRRILRYPDRLLPKSLRFTALAFMETGVVLTILSFVPGAPMICRASSLLVTSLFCSACGAMYYRQLLRYLIFSFDFAFLSTQFTAIHLCLCDLLSWDARTVPVVSSWLWIHWVLTFDCMPPAIKTKWGFRYRFVVWIAILFVLAHIAVACQVTFGRRDTLRDRAMVSIHVLDHHLELRVLPTMLSRMLVTFGWSCRIAWRLWRRKENELLIIQGTVTYVNNRKKLKRDEEELERLQSATRPGITLQKIARRIASIVSLHARVPPSSKPTSEASVSQLVATMGDDLNREGPPLTSIPEMTSPQPR